MIFDFVKIHNKINYSFIFILKKSVFELLQIALEKHSFFDLSVTCSRAKIFMNLSIFVVVVVVAVVGVVVVVATSNVLQSRMCTVKNVSNFEQPIFSKDLIRKQK